MTFLELRTILAERLGSRNDLDGMIINEMKLAQRNMERAWPESTMPWFMVTRNTIIFDSGSGVAQIFPDFIRECDNAMTVVQRYSEDLDDFGTEVPAQKVFSEQETLAQIRDTQMVCEVDTIYSLEGTTVSIHPDAPTIVGGRAALYLTMSYYAEQPVESETALSNAWTVNAPELLIAATGRQVARYIHDGEIAAMFEQDYQMEFQKLITANQEREISNIEMVIRS